MLKLLGLGGASLGMSMSGFSLMPRLAMAQSTGSGSGKNIVVVNLFGGIDGLGAFPFYEGSQVNAIRNVLRPTLTLPTNQILPHIGQNGSGSKIGFHPSFEPLVSRAGNNIALVQGYGIPGDPGRSHDTCQILMSLGATELQGGNMVGFLARLMDLQNWDSFQYWAFANENPSDTNSQKKPPVLVSDLENLDIPYIGWESEGESEFAWRIQERLLELQVPRDSLSNALTATTQTMRSTIASVRSDIIGQQVGSNAAGEYSDDSFGSSLRDTMKLLKAKTSEPSLGNYQKDMLILTGQGGYDTHSDQSGDLPFLTGSLAGNLAVFYEDLNRFGLLNDTVVVAYSEFGRTTYENGTAGQASVGTDHGHASTTFVMGGSVNAGVIGNYPTTSELTSDYNALRPQIDFRDVFGDIFAWLGVSPEAVFADPAYRRRSIGLMRT